MVGEEEMEEFEEHDYNVQHRRIQRREQLHFRFLMWRLVYELIYLKEDYFIFQGF